MRTEKSEDASKRAATQQDAIVSQAQKDQHAESDEPKADSAPARLGNEERDESEPKERDAPDTTNPKGSDLQAKSELSGKGSDLAEPEAKNAKASTESTKNPSDEANEPDDGTDEANAAVAEAPEPVLPPFDQAAAKAALGAAAAQASSCRKGDDPAGTAEVLITFAPSGRITSANVAGGPFAGTATGGCVAAALRRAKVPAFSGKYVTVRKTVRLN